MRRILWYTVFCFLGLCVGLLSTEHHVIATEREPSAQTQKRNANLDFMTSWSRVEWFLRFVSVTPKPRQQNLWTMKIDTISYPRYTSGMPRCRPDSRQVYFRRPKVAELARKMTTTTSKAPLTNQLMYHGSITERKAVVDIHRTICIGVPKTRKSRYLYPPGP